MDIGKDLQQAWNDGYEKGRKDASIARQSVKSEEVAEAIERLEKWRASKYAWTVASAPCGKNIDLAITALQAYQPTTYNYCPNCGRRLD